MSRGVWIDSTFARSPKRIRELRERIKASGQDWQLRVHPQVYLEQARRQATICRESNQPFSEERFRSFLRVNKVEVVGFVMSEELVLRWGKRLAERYPAESAWQQAKRDSLGVEVQRAAMTCDWLIALAAEDDPGAVVITNDTGEEWSFLRSERRVLTHEQAESFPSP